jgi:CRP-like cAMP-binding protein
MIGASRETVTRALKYFRQNELITLKGSDLIIHDQQRLKAAIGNRGGSSDM